MLVQFPTLDRIHRSIRDNIHDKTVSVAVFAETRLHHAEIALEYVTVSVVGRTAKGYSFFLGDSPVLLRAVFR